MKNKIKTIIKIEFNSLVVLLMSLAAIFGMIEITYKNPYKLSLIPSETVAYVKVSPSQNTSNPIRRERDEVDTQYVSYAESQRTSPRTGRY